MDNAPMHAVWLAPLKAPRKKATQGCGVVEEAALADFRTPATGKTATTGMTESRRARHGESQCAHGVVQAKNSERRKWDAVSPDPNAAYLHRRVLKDSHFSPEHAVLFRGARNTAYVHGSYQELFRAVFASALQRTSAPVSAET